MKRSIFFASLCAAGLGLSAMAQDGPATTLGVGDDAPALEISHWIKGEPVKEFEEGKVYVMEFWATWCGPCKTSMPHIAKVQEEYKDYLQVVSVSDEDLPTVIGFMVQDDKPEGGTQWYEKMAYTVATDPDKSVYTDYMKAAGQNGIPTAFIVGKTGQIEWIGHPMSMDEPIKAIVNDEWDRDAHAKKMAIAEKAQRKIQTLMQSAREAQAQGDIEQAIKVFDEIIALDERYSYLETSKFEMMITADDPAAGYAFGSKLAKASWDDSMTLNSLAWFVVDDASVKERDLGFAMRIAKRACELTDFEDAAILDTYARVFYEKGDMKMALKWQREAVKHSADGAMADGVKATLEQYEKEADQN